MRYVCVRQQHEKHNDPTLIKRFDPTHLYIFMASMHSEMTQHQRLRCVPQ